jgi:hypothetical protein
MAPPSAMRFQESSNMHEAATSDSSMLDKVGHALAANHLMPGQPSVSFQLVLATEDYKLNCEASSKFSPDISGSSTGLNGEFLQDVLVDIAVELANLEKPRERRGQISAQSISQFSSHVRVWWAKACASHSS